MGVAGNLLLDSFYVSRAALAASPSAADGVPPAVEAAARATAAALALRGAAALRAPPGVGATAAVLLHRFYCKVSLLAAPPATAAAALTFLALKLDEAYDPASSSRRVLAVFHRLEARARGVASPEPPPEPGTAAFEAAKATLVRTERVALRALGFILHVEHPHKLVLQAAHMLALGDAGTATAWALANDCLRTPLPVLHPAPVLAAGVVFLAARLAGVPLPEGAGGAWWGVLGASAGGVADVAASLRAALARPPPVTLDVVVDRGRGGGAPAPAGPRAPPPAAATAAAVAAARAAAQRFAAAAANPPPHGDRKRPRSRERRPSPEEGRRGRASRWAPPP